MVDIWVIHVSVFERYAVHTEFLDDSPKVYTCM